MIYTCNICGYEYDEQVGDIENSIPAGTAWEALPDDYVCPLCGVGKEDFDIKAVKSKKINID